MHINIPTPGCSIAQREMVRGKSRTVNHMKNSEIRSRRNPEDGPTRRSNQNVHIVGKRTPKITSLGRILRAFNHDGCTNIRRINEPQTQIIDTLNKSTNLKHISLLRQTNRRILKIESTRRWRNWEAVYVHTSRLKRKSCTTYAKPYKYTQAA